jgi:hypothetical protein
MYDFYEVKSQVEHLPIIVAHVFGDEVKTIEIYGKNGPRSDHRDLHKI